MASASAEPAASPILDGGRVRRGSLRLMSKATNPQAVDIPRHALLEVTIMHQWVPWATELQARPEVDPTEDAWVREQSRRESERRRHD